MAILFTVDDIVDIMYSTHDCMDGDTIYRVKKE